MFSALVTTVNAGRLTAGTIGQRAPAILLLCFHYDPSTGRYSLEILKLLKLMGGLTLFPQILINVKLKPGQDWKAASGLAQAQANAQRELEGRGRLLIRPSGTEPLVRVMVEASDQGLAQRCANALADVLRA